VIVSFGPSHVDTQGAQVDILDVKGLMDTIGIGHWGYWASYPGINVHIICEGGSHQPVPEVFIPQAVLGDRLERHASCSLN
jgi:hypothetical protein